MIRVAIVLTLVFFISFLLLACNTGPTSPRGFSLPEGDIAKGEAVFRKYQCLACHTLQGVEDEAVAKEFATPVQLGGVSTRVKTYGELVTSVINPSHKISPRYNVNVMQENGMSKMRIYNDVMTVTELVDLVAFLQPKYQVQPYQYTRYGQYHIP